MADSMREGLNRVDDARDQAVGQAQRTARQAGYQADQFSRQMMDMEPTNTILDTMENMSPQTYLTAVGGSIAASLFLYLIGKKGLALFIGLWAPTILNLGLYNKMLRPSKD